MIVRTQSKGREIVGLVIGSSNARRYFAQKPDLIELELGHLRIACDLDSSFWDGEAEIRDPRLCLWLQSKQTDSSDSSLDMSPTGLNAFRLGPAKRNECQVRKHEPVEIETAA